MLKKWDHLQNFVNDVLKKSYEDFGYPHMTMAYCVIKSQMDKIAAEEDCSSLKEAGYF